MKYVVTAVVMLTFPLWIIPGMALALLYTLYTELHDILWGERLSEREKPERWVESE